MDNQTAIAKVATDVQLTEIIAKLDVAVVEAKAIVVADIKSFDLAANYFRSFKDASKQLDEIRKKANAPYDEIIKANNNYIKTALMNYADVVAQLERQMQEFKESERIKAEAEQRKLQQEANERALREAAEREQRAKEFAKQNGIDENKVNVPTPEAPIIPTVMPQKVSQMTSANVKSVRTGTWRIVDLNKVPQKYFILNEKLINAERRAMGVDCVGTSYIPGIEFTVSESIR